MYRSSSNRSAYLPILFISLFLFSGLLYPAVGTHSTYRSDASASKLKKGQVRKRGGDFDALPFAYTVLNDYLMTDDAAEPALLYAAIDEYQQAVYKALLNQEDISALLAWWIDSESLLASNIPLPALLLIYLTNAMMTIELGGDAIEPEYLKSHRDFVGVKEDPFLSEMLALVRMQYKAWASYRREGENQNTLAALAETIRFYERLFQIYPEQAANYLDVSLKLFCNMLLIMGHDPRSVPSGSGSYSESSAGESIPLMVLEPTVIITNRGGKATVAILPHDDNGDPSPPPDRKEPKALPADGVQNDIIERLICLIKHLIKFDVPAEDISEQIAGTLVKKQLFPPQNLLAEITVEHSSRHSPLRVALPDEYSHEIEDTSTSMSTMRITNGITEWQEIFNWIYLNTMVNEIETVRNTLSAYGNKQATQTIIDFIEEQYKHLEFPKPANSTTQLLSSHAPFLQRKTETKQLSGDEMSDLAATRLIGLFNQIRIVKTEVTTDWLANNIAKQLATHGLLPPLGLLVPIASELASKRDVPNAVVTTESIIKEWKEILSWVGLKLETNEVQDIKKHLKCHGNKQAGEIIIEHLANIYRQ